MIPKRCKHYLDKIKLPDNSKFLSSILEKAKKKQLECQISRYNFELSTREVYSLSFHQLMFNFSTKKIVLMKISLNFLKT